MNEILRSLSARKSVRAYTERPIEADKKRAILEAAIQAPTAGNMSLFTILDITDRAIKERLAVTCDNQPFIAKAPLVLVFCADYRRWYDVFCTYEDAVRQPAEGDLLLAMADTLIAAQNAVVAAESLGLGSCYIGDIIENYEVHKELLHLPRYVAPVCMLCIGYPTAQQQSRGKPPRFAVEELVCENTYTSISGEAMGERMARRDGIDADRLPERIRAFCTRKWNSDFSVEMSRSAAAIIADWCGK